MRQMAAMLSVHRATVSELAAGWACRKRHRVIAFRGDLLGEGRVQTPTLKARAALSRKAAKDDRHYQI